MAIYARARALDLAGRCTEASEVYHEYADFVRAREAQSAKAAIEVALLDAGRCDEARRTFDRYAHLVRNDDPQSAAMALNVANDCIEMHLSR